MVYAGFDQWVLNDGSGFINDKCAPLLMVLQMLNVYWFFLIFRMIFRFAEKGKAVDIQSRDTIKKETEKT